MTFATTSRFSLVSTEFTDKIISLQSRLLYQSEGSSQSRNIALLTPGIRITPRQCLLYEELLSSAIPRRSEFLVYLFQLL